jgi:hypothetical protein
LGSNPQLDDAEALALYLVEVMRHAVRRELARLLMSERGG